MTSASSNQSGEWLTRAGMMAMATAVTRVRLVGSKFSHYILRDKLRTFEDKTTAIALCHTKPGRGEAWRFNENGRMCNACHAEASTKGMVVGSPPVLLDVQMVPTMGTPGPMEAVLLTSKFGGRCRRCQNAYDPGEMIWWRRGQGCAHHACGKEVLSSGHGGPREVSP
jgi:hypothetical protein